jgi:hypothetical protein
MAQEFEFEENQNNYGVLDYKHAHTLKRYKELCDERCKVDVSKYDCFFAFSDKQFSEGLKSIRPLQEGEKIVSIGAGGYGTKDGAKRLFEFYDSINDKIRSECNPQEVYVYEYNNHECCLDWDGDLNAIRIIATVWGEDVARTIKRKNACYPIESIFK